MVEVVSALAASPRGLVGASLPPFDQHLEFLHECRAPTTALVVTTRGASFPERPVQHDFRAACAQLNGTTAVALGKAPQFSGVTRAFVASLGGGVDPLVPSPDRHLEFLHKQHPFATVLSLAAPTPPFSAGARRAVRLATELRTEVAPSPSTLLQLDCVRSSAEWPHAGHALVGGSDNTPVALARCHV